MSHLKDLLANNQKWASSVLENDPLFFERLSKQQSPRYLWIGCSDSRVPANQICGLDPGEIFVHRNVANMVVHTDLNCLSVVQFAVDVLKVKHIIVCGHYGCGGVNGALDNQSLGLIDNWLRNIKDVYAMHQKELDKLSHDRKAQSNRLCELNIKAQVANLCYTTIVQEAWRRDQELHIHGWAYGITNGLLKDLKISVSRPEQILEVFRMNSIES